MLTVYRTIKAQKNLHVILTRLANRNRRKLCNRVYSLQEVKELKQLFAKDQGDWVVFEARVIGSALVHYIEGSRSKTWIDERMFEVKCKEYPFLIFDNLWAACTDLYSDLVEELHQVKPKVEDIQRESYDDAVGYCAPVMIKEPFVVCFAPRTEMTRLSQVRRSQHGFLYPTFGMYDSTV